MKDYRVCVKVKNNYLLTKMEENGIYTARELARQSEVSPTEVCNFINIKKGAYTKENQAREAIKRICKVLNCLPEDVFPEQHLYLGLERNTAQVEIDFQEVQQLFAPETNPETLLIQNEDSIELQSIIDGVLPSRTKEIIEKRFDGMSYKDIGKIHGISSSRTQQLMTKGLKRVRESISNR
jgi:RNA polymerase sigma factor (sigma-70 family)